LRLVAKRFWFSLSRFESWPGSFSSFAVNDWQPLSVRFVDALTLEPLHQGNHLLPGVFGELLAQLGRLDEA
jgi:hypothetical protein